MPYEPKRSPLDPCPVEAVLVIISGKWKVRILYQLSLEACSFADLMRGMGGIKQQVLTTQLRALEKDGVVNRAVHSEKDSKLRYSIYSLTKEGLDLIGILRTMALWGEDRLRIQGLNWQAPTQIRSKRMK